jgi:GntR family transcriptional regulator
VAPQPRYRAIAQALREEIIAGELRPGEKLPPEARLVERFGVSRDTIRDATKMLIQEGLVERGGAGRTGGMIVRDRLMLVFHASYAEEPGAPRSETDSWATDVRAQGLNPSQDFTCVNVVLPDGVALRLGEPEGAAGVLRRCVRYVNGHPSSIQDTYYPSWLTDEVPDLRQPSDIIQGTTALLAERGHVQVGYLDHTSARMPNPEETTLLHIGPGTPVLLKTRTGATRSRVVRVTIEIMVGDTNTVEYEIGDISAISGKDSTP